MGLWQLSSNSDSEMTQKVPESNSEFSPENQWGKDLDVLFGIFWVGLFSGVNLLLVSASVHLKKANGSVLAGIHL